jgi:hypothetical protein
LWLNVGIDGQSSNPTATLAGFGSILPANSGRSWQAKHRSWATQPNPHCSE